MHIFLNKSNNFWSWCHDMSGLIIWPTEWALTGWGSLPLRPKLVFWISRSLDSDLMFTSLNPQYGNSSCYLCKTSDVLGCLLCSPSLRKQEAARQAQCGCWEKFMPPSMWPFLQLLTAHMEKGNYHFSPLSVSHESSVFECLCIPNPYQQDTAVKVCQILTKAATTDFLFF